MRVLYLFLCLFLISVSAVKKLNNVDDLKKVDYGKRSPRHGLKLLFWLAQRVANIDQNKILYLRNLDPKRGDFGFHLFRNRDRRPLLPILGSGSYYSVGNLNYPRANAFPGYVLEDYRNNRNLQESNMDRLILRLTENHSNRVRNVFITAHNLGRNDFNPSDTYEISPELIQQIRQPNTCPRDQNNNNALSEDEEDEECIQFLNDLLYNFCKRRRRDLHFKSLWRAKRATSNPNCETFKETNLEINATNKGYVKLIWKNIPATIINKYTYVYIDICKINHSSNTDQRKFEKQLSIDQLSGILDTPVPLNAGLQPQLRMYTSWINYRFGKPTIWYGPEFDEANRVIPTRIKGCDASIQLYTTGGWACARLYIKKTFSNWKNVFYYSWVGFYKSTQDEKYYTWNYAVNFEKLEENVTEDYDIYQYVSGLAIAPGVQIRFLLDKGYDKVLARTPAWEGVDEEKMSLSDCEKLNPGQNEPSSHLSDPEMFYWPEFDDANRLLPTKIKEYDAGLQLYTKDGKACARFYIKKTFSTWKDVFYYSWVGFYCSTEKCNDDYAKYQYAVKFEKMKDDHTMNYDIYQYKSSLAIAPGLQIRFLLDKGYDNVLARTPAWEGVDKEKMSLSDCDKLNPGLSDPEMFNWPEFDDANRLLPTKIKEYDAGLQLYTKDGKACARLYIKKTFSTWKDVFYYSWVGFYCSTGKANKDYAKYQYAVKFEKMKDDHTMNYDIYQYKSSLAIAPGLQIRFLLNKSYDYMLGKTDPWKSV